MELIKELRNASEADVEKAVGRCGESSRNQQWLRSSTMIMPVHSDPNITVIILQLNQ